MTRIRNQHELRRTPSTPRDDDDDDGGGDGEEEESAVPAAEDGRVLDRRPFIPSQPGRRDVSLFRRRRRRPVRYSSAPLAFAVLVALGSVLIPTADGLYAASDKVQLLDAKNFESWVFRSKAAWIVEFYSSWCGFCKGFAPTWKKFGEEINGWRATVRIGGVDCADDTNVELCRRYVPVGYPTVRLFPPGLTSRTFEGEQIEAVVRETVPSLTQKVADFAEEIKIKYDMENFPDLSLRKDEPLPPFGQDELARLLIFEDSEVKQEGSVDTRPYLLEASLYKGVRAFRLGPNHPMRTQLAVESVPATVILDSNSKPVSKHENKILPKEQIHSALSEVLGNKKVVDSFEYNAGMPQNDDTFVKGGAASGRLEFPPLIPVHMQDLENAIAYSLRHEAILRREISGEARDGLYNWVKMLIQYFPGDRRVIESLTTIKEFLDTRQALTGEELQAKITEMDGRAGSRPTLPKVGPYTTCQGSSKKYRGFPCSMWSLFHVLSIEALRKGDQQKFREVPQAIFGFIKNFFSCKYCARHFAEMVTESWEDFRDLAEMVLWLWRSHNKVNKRLARDISEDPMHPKVQFPAKPHCPDCFNSDFSDWKLANVFEFLQKRYGSEKIVPKPQSQQEEQSVNVGPPPPPQDSGGAQQHPKDVRVAESLLKRGKTKESKLHPDGTDSKRQPALPKDESAESHGRRGHGYAHGYEHDHHHRSDDHRHGRGGSSTSDFTFTSLMHLGSAAVLVIFYCVITNRRRVKRRMSSVLPLFTRQRTPPA